MVGISIDEIENYISELDLIGNLIDSVDPIDKLYLILRLWGLTYEKIADINGTHCEKGVRYRVKMVTKRFYADNKQ